MEKREKVIQHFEDCIKIADCQINHWVFVRAEILRDALALLKAQEPRVMKLAETYGLDCVWYEQKIMGIRPAKISRVEHKTGVYRVMRFGDIDAWEHADEYGEYWRCWSHRPEDDQREATPWND